MQQATKARILKTLRTLHAWLGILILPWIFMIGLTGFYMNHAKAVLRVMEPAGYDEAQFDLWPNAQDLTVSDAMKIALSVWPDNAIPLPLHDDYHDRPSFTFKMASGTVIVTRATGHYFVKTNFRRKTYAPDGSLLHSKIYWGSVFKILHARGWLNNSVGTWLADITSIALLLFAASGIFLWWMPRAKKIKRTLKISGRKHQA